MKGHADHAETRKHARAALNMQGQTEIPRTDQDKRTRKEIFERSVHCEEKTECERESLFSRTSAILQNNNTLKYKDPGCPTISCFIGEHKIEKALLNLGASVNLLLYSVFQSLILGELKPTSITLLLVDRCKSAYMMRTSPEAPARTHYMF